MQAGILLLGALLFVFYQFQAPPIFFNTVAWQQQASGPHAAELQTLEADYARTHAETRASIDTWLAARQRQDTAAEAAAIQDAQASRTRGEQLRDQAKAILKQGAPRLSTNDADYVFITFVLHQLPHGLIGLLVAAFLAAALQSKSAELTALGATTTVDFYRHILRREAGDEHHVLATRWFTAFWGVVAMSFALFASMSENLIQAVNIVGSIFYGVALGLVLVAFFAKHVQGTAVFWAGVASQLLVFVLFATLEISYLWYNVIGCGACVLLSLALQAIVDRRPGPSSLPG
jgi:Na+(H+)/acetate symporter ActP